jgi:hypothetical protein
MARIQGIGMRIKTRKIPALGAYPRLVYSAPSAQPESAARTSPYRLTVTKALPFVKPWANDQPSWHPESFWRVRSTGNRQRDIQLGRKYARQAISAMKADGNSALIALILQDVIKDAVTQAAKTGRRHHSPTVLGFLREISQSLADAS